MWSNARTYDQVTAFSRKMCLFRDVAYVRTFHSYSRRQVQRDSVSLEVYFKDNRSLLIVCASKKRRQEIGDKLSEKIALRVQNDSRSPLLFRNPLIGKASARVMVNVRDELYTAQRKWQAREISNVSFSALSSGRPELSFSSRISAFSTSRQVGRLSMQRSILSSVCSTTTPRLTFCAHLWHSMGPGRLCL